MTCMAKADPDRCTETLSRQMPTAASRRMPPDQGADHAEITDRIQPEWCSQSHGRDDHSGQSRPHRPTDIEADTVQRYRRREILARHQLGHDRLPCGGDQGRSASGKKGEREQEDRGCPAGPDQHTQDCNEHRRSNLDEEQEMTAINNVGQRSSREDEQEHRQRGRNLHKGNGQGIRVEPRHQPAGSSILHPGANVRYDSGNPENRERGVTERAPRGSRSCRRNLSGDSSSSLPSPHHRSPFTSSPLSLPWQPFR